MELRRYAGVMALHEGRVALVREQHDRWGGAFWNVPSGMVEPHETPESGAVRELAEETGLVSSPDELRLVSTSATTGDGRRSLAWNFVTHVDDPALAVSDPDGHILEARWFNPDDAIGLLTRLPYRPLSEPTVAHLTGSAEPGAHWDYERADCDPVVTVRR